MHTVRAFIFVILGRIYIRMLNDTNGLAQSGRELSATAMDAMCHIPMATMSWY
jgi:hypothetical protein